MIFFETSGQALTFLMLLRAGMGAGIAYDVIAPLRRRAPRPLAAAMDVMWCGLAAGACLLALMAGGEGKMRLYALLGLFGGAAVYCLGIRRMVGWAWRRMGKGKEIQA